MSTRAVIGLFLAGTAGIVIFLFVTMSQSSDGTVHVGPRTAAACSHQTDCLPRLNWIDTNGTVYTPEALAGKVVVVNFWATWCKPCQKEIPDFSKVAERYEGKAVVLGVLTDGPDSAKLLNYMSDYNMSYPVIRTKDETGIETTSGHEILLAFSYPGQLPTTFMFDTRGNPVMFDDGRGGKRRAHVGMMTADKLSAEVEKLLPAAAP